METIELEKEFKIICNKLSESLKKDIKDKGHYGTGELYKSIQVYFKKDKENKYTITTSANKYLIYLDEGKFMEDWIKKEKPYVTEAIALATKRDIKNALKQFFK